ncbi:hypothetical protein BOX15_Mlig012770g1 [Macrostomum lignano]|uniref:T-box domain-containing protein n=1 Tax=Macrostomum lignano TaxID=282301 RepID=A0A267F5V9_9PLAT|nr:hypothetical protein BOX15_Mlig012770g1 [Macrostomum lignano]
MKKTNTTVKGSCASDPAAAAELTTAAEVTPLVKSTSRTQVQQGFQPRYLANVAPSGEQVEISLSNSSTWRKFSRQNTEMIVTKVGRRMFPTLSLDIQGLDPAKKYEVYVTLMLADRHTLKYQRGVWLPNGQGEVYPPPGCTVGLAYVHPDSPAPGKHWTRQEVAFMRLKLTNKLDCFASEPARNGTMIFAYSMHKYLPVVHIRELAKNATAFYTAVTFPGTEFITVTAYQNPELTDLKIQFNPYAKGIRNQGDRSGPLLIDSFRPTVQALQHQHQQQQQQQQQQQLHVKTEGLNAPKFQVEQQPSEVSPAQAVEFGSYPSQTDLSYGRWSNAESVATSASHRHRPYSITSSSSTLTTASNAAKSLVASLAQPGQELPAQMHSQARSWGADATEHDEVSQQPEDFSQQFAYNPYPWYLPSVSHQQQLEQQQQHEQQYPYYYYQQYQQAYQQHSAQFYYPNYCFQQQQQQTTQERETPQPQVLQCSTLLHNATDSSPSGLSFEQAE